MPAKHSRHIALTGPLADWVDQRVQEGEYSSVSDLIRAAVRLLKERDEGRGTARQRAASGAAPWTKNV